MATNATFGIKGKNAFDTEQHEKRQDKEIEEGGVGIRSVQVSLVEDSGDPEAESSLEDGNLSITLKNLKGEKGDDGDTGPEGLQGPQGDSAVFDPDDPNTPSFVMANTTGLSTTKAMTQKAVTVALADQTIAEWENITLPNPITGLKIDTDGTVSSAGSGRRIYYTQVTKGLQVKINADFASHSINLVVSVFDDVPDTGDEAIEVIEYMPQEDVEGEYKSQLVMPCDGYLAFFCYGADTHCTMQKGITYNELSNELASTAQAKATQVETDVANILGGVEEEIHPNTVSGYMISKLSDKTPQSSFSITEPIPVEKGDVVRYTANGGSGGSNSIMNLTDAEGSEYTSKGNDKGLKQRIYEVEADGYICISFATADGLEIYITHGGLQAKVEDLEKNVATYEEDGTISLLENPLEHLISSPSRVRTFASYGIIGASFETGYTNASGGQVFYDDGYEWPTLMGKVNGVDIYNYALPGHTFRAWLADRNKTDFSLSDTPFFGNHYMPWNTDTHTPECFIVNLSSNDVSSSSGYDVGNPSDIDLENDYTDATQYPIENMTFCQAATAILQLIRQKCPRCYIFVATVRKGVSNTTRAAALNEALVAIAGKFSKCYVLDVYQYGMDWSQGVGKYVSGGDGSHPTRLGHVYLADQFNTYIDWYIGKHPELFLEAAYVNPHKTRVKENGVWRDEYVTFDRT